MDGLRPARPKRHGRHPARPVVYLRTQGGKEGAAVPAGGVSLVGLWRDVMSGLTYLARSSN